MAENQEFPQAGMDQYGVYFWDPVFLDNRARLFAD